MTKIFKPEELPDDEKVFLKKDFLGEWRVVYPWKRGDGSINWFAVFFGNKGNLVYLFLIALILGLLWVGINEMLSGCRELAENCILPSSNITFASEVDSLRLVQPGLNITLP